MRFHLEISSQRNSMHSWCMAAAAPRGQALLVRPEAVPSALHRIMCVRLTVYRRSTTALANRRSDEPGQEEDAQSGTKIHMRLIGKLGWLNWRVRGKVRVRTYERLDEGSARNYVELSVATLE